MSANPRSFRSRYRAMEAHLQQEGLLDKLVELPSVQDMRFLDEKSFRIEGTTHAYSVLMEVGKSFGHNWAAANGDIIQEQAGSLGMTKFWTRSSGLVLYAPSPFDTPGIREGLATPMSPKTLALIRFYLVHYMRTRDRKDQTLNFPNFEDLTKALRTVLRSPRTDEASPALSAGNPTQVPLGINGIVLGDSVPAPSAAFVSSFSHQEASPLHPSGVPDMARTTLEVGSTPMNSTPSGSNQGTSRSYNSLFESPGKATTRTSDPIAQWQANLPEEYSDPNIGDLHDIRSDDAVRPVAGNELEFASWLNLTPRAGKALLEYLPPIKDIKILSLPRNGYVRLQIRLGKVDGRPLHACFKLTANKKVSPSFFVLVRGAKLMHQSFGDAWTKMDFGNLEDIVQVEPSKIEWPFSAAGTQEELKALCKWYFILAAESELDGFQDPLFPFNETLVEHLTKACMRVKATRDDDMVDGDDGIEGSNDGPWASNSPKGFSAASTLVGGPGVNLSVDSFPDFLSHRSTTASNSSTAATVIPQTTYRLLAAKRSKKKVEVRKHPARRPTTPSKHMTSRDKSPHISQILASHGMKRTRKQFGAAGEPVKSKTTMISKLQAEWDYEQEKLKISKKQQAASQKKLNAIHIELMGLLQVDSME